MTKTQLYEELNYVNHSREKRLYYANLVISTPALIKPLLDILFDVNNKISCRAAWVYEFLCHKNLEASIPHLDYFTAHIHKVHLDSAVRPVAKVCEYLVMAYYSKSDNPIKQSLSALHQERIIESCFDWMINDEKVAPKAYAMNCLFLLGRDYDWIHPELINILERDYHSQSVGFRARAKRIIKTIKRR